jgi:hypothetical protein
MLVLRFGLMIYSTTIEMIMLQVGLGRCGGRSRAVGGAGAAAAPAREGEREGEEEARPAAQERRQGKGRGRGACAACFTSLYLCYLFFLCYFLRLILSVLLLLLLLLLLLPTPPLPPGPRGKAPARSPAGAGGSPRGGSEAGGGGVRILWGVAAGGTRAGHLRPPLLLGALCAEATARVDGRCCDETVPNTPGGMSSYISFPFFFFLFSPHKESRRLILVLLTKYLTNAEAIRALPGLRSFFTLSLHFF